MRSRSSLAGRALLLALGLPLVTAAAELSFTLAAVKGVVPEASKVLRVTQGDTVVVALSSDMAGEAHLHGYKLAAKLVPGTPAMWRFNARASGRFRVEWHAAGDTASHHHGPPMATLEVLPK